MLNRIVLTVATLLCLSQTANAGTFAKLYQDQMNLRQDWTRILFQALHSDKTPSEILNSFPKVDQEIAKIVTSGKMPAAHFEAQRLGDLIVFTDGKTIHQLKVLDAYPDLKLSYDGTTLRFPLKDKKQLKTVLTAWMKLAGGGKKTSSFFSLLPEAYADDAGDYLGTAAIAAGLGGAATYYLVRQLVRESDRGFGTTTNIYVDNTEVARQLAAIASTEQELVAIHQKLAAVEIPNKTLELAARPNLDPSSAKEIETQTNRALENQYGKIYEPLLSALRYSVDHGKINAGVCALRKEGAGSFASVTNKDAGTPIASERKATSSDGDRQELKVGDLSFKIDYRSKNPAAHFAPDNQEISHIYICRGMSCQEGSKENLADRIGQEVRRRATPKLDTSKIEKFNVSLPKKLADADAESANACKKIENEGKLLGTELRPCGWHNWGPQTGTVLKVYHQYMNMNILVKARQHLPYGSSFDGCEEQEIYKYLDHLSASDLKKIGTLTEDSVREDSGACSKAKAAVIGLHVAKDASEHILGYAKLYNDSINDDGRAHENSAVFAGMVELLRPGLKNVDMQKNICKLMGNAADYCRNRNYNDSDADDAPDDPQQPLFDASADILPGLAKALGESVGAANSLDSADRLAACCQDEFCQKHLSAVEAVNATEKAEKPEAPATPEQ